MNQISLSDEHQDRFDVPKSFKELWDMLSFKAKHQTAIRALQFDTHSGVLLVGPPGVGKTFNVGRMCQHLGVALTVVRGPEIMKSYVGGSEAELKRIFSTFETSLCSSSLSVLLFDEVVSAALSVVNLGCAAHLILSSPCHSGFHRHEI